MGHHQSHEEAIKGVYQGLVLLAVITLIEVVVSLFGKGHLGIDPSGSSLVLGIVGFLLIALSVYKAYFIIYKFMHLGDEVRGMRLSVLLPCFLLVWAVIAFFNEGSAWFNRRDLIKQKDERGIEDNKINNNVQGNLMKNEDTYQL